MLCYLHYLCDILFFIGFLWFLDMFIKLWKSSSSCLYVCLPFCMEQLGSQWMDFHEIWYLSIFQTSVEKVQVSLKYAINKGTIHKGQYTFLILSHSVLLRMRNVSDISYGENQHTHFRHSLPKCLNGGIVIRCVVFSMIPYLVSNFVMIPAVTNIEDIYYFPIFSY
jgi:hypothetical protein